MCSEQCETVHFGDGSSCGSSNQQIRTKLVNILTDTAPVDWDVVNGLLPYLKIESDSCEQSYASPLDDPMGRLLITRILSRDPPAAILDAVITIFPKALLQNPASFLAAFQCSTLDVLRRMFLHVSGRDDQCPYPWIISDCISVEDAKNILQMFPEGVMKPSSFLSSCNLLDYFLVSPDMVKCRTFDIKLWKKLKLVLVAFGSLLKNECSCCGCEIAPVHVILNRVLSRSDFWTSSQTVEHVLWLLHQLRWTDRWVFEKQSKNGRYPIHVVLSYQCTSDQQGLVAARALTQLLLEACSESAAHRVNGKLPLHMAVENGWPCHDLLLAAHPESLDALDQTTELLPFQTAAKHHRSFETPVSLNMTYELLRANPVHACCLHKETRGVRAQA